MKANAVSATSFVERGRKFGRLDAEFVDPEVLTLEGELVQMYGAKPLGFINVNSVRGYRRPKVCTGSRQKYVTIDDIDLQDGMALSSRARRGGSPRKSQAAVGTLLYYCVERPSGARWRWNDYRVSK